MDFKENPSSSPVNSPGNDPSDLLRTPTMWAVTGFGASSAEGPKAQTGALPAETFDVCHLGVVLRVVLGVHGTLALACLPGADSAAEWLRVLAQAVAVALPATLLWLLGLCGLRHRLSRLGTPGLMAAVGGWGALCALYGQLQFSAVAVSSGLTVWGLWQWLPATLIGAAMALVGLQWLRLRRSHVDPAQTQARLAELQARIRPHFLFNALNTAIALVQVDPERAEAVLEDLAELFRHALTSPAIRTTLGAEAELARRYLAIEQLRFGQRLQVSWHLGEGTESAVVPALFLQPLVENAIRHGVERLPEGGWLRLESRREGQEVRLMVSNAVPEPGTGHGPSGVGHQGHGIALRNVHHRLELMHDLAMRFEAGLRPVTPGAAQHCWMVSITLPASSPGTPR